MTINKAQSHTFNTVGLYLPEHSFAYGLIYIALSRVRAPVTIRAMLNFDNSTQLVDQKVLLSEALYIMKLIMIFFSTYVFIFNFIYVPLYIDT